MARVTYAKVVYRNGLERKFVWEDGIMTDTGTEEQTPMSWEVIENEGILADNDEEFHITDGCGTSHRYRLVTAKPTW